MCSILISLAILDASYSDKLNLTVGTISGSEGFSV